MKQSTKAYIAPILEGAALCGITMFGLWAAIQHSEGWYLVMWTLAIFNGVKLLDWLTGL